MFRSSIGTKWNEKTLSYLEVLYTYWVICSIKFDIELNDCSSRKTFKLSTLIFGNPNRSPSHHIFWATLSEYKMKLYPFCIHSLTLFSTISFSIAVHNHFWRNFYYRRFGKCIGVRCHCAALNDAYSNKLLFIQFSGIGSALSAFWWVNIKEKNKKTKNKLNK